MALCLFFSWAQLSPGLGRREVEDWPRFRIYHTLRQDTSQLDFQPYLTFALKKKKKINADRVKLETSS